GSIARGYCGYGRASVVRGGRNHRRICERSILCQRALKWANHGAGLNYLREQVGGKVKFLDKGACPGTRQGIDKLGGGCVGEFADCLTGEPVVEKIGYGQKFLCTAENGWSLPLGCIEL